MNPFGQQPIPGPTPSAPPTQFYVPIPQPPNARELATYEQARQLRDYLNSKLSAPYVVLPGDDEGLQSGPTTGIYIPHFFGTPPPSQGEFHYIVFQFASGANGFNVGLIIDKFSRYPMSPAYVLSAIAAEIQQMSK